MNSFPEEFEELVKRFSEFPGVGRRSAERIVFHILKMEKNKVQALSQLIAKIGECIKPCKICNNFSAQDICSICRDPKRDRRIVCIVEEPKDILAIEKASHYRGVYYALLGAISPLEGIGPQDLSIRKLINRLEKGEIDEVIISTDSDTEGELTAQFLIEKISPYKVKIYRISIGVPLGTQIEYIDSATLKRAFIEKKPLT